MGDYLVMTQTAYITKRRWRRVTAAVLSVFPEAAVTRDEIKVGYVTLSRYPYGRTWEGRQYFKVYCDDGLGLAAVVVFACAARLTLKMPEFQYHRPAAAERLKGAGFIEEAWAFSA